MTWDSHSVQTLFQLLRIALGKEEPISLPNDVEWQDVYDLSLQHGAGAIACDGLLTIQDNAINEELMQGVNRAKQFVNDPENQRKASGCFTTFIKICFFSVVGFFAFIFGMILLCVLIALGLSLGAAVFGLGSAFVGLGMDPDLVSVLNTIPTWLQWTFAGATILVIAIPFCLLLHKLLRGPEAKPMSSGAVATTIIIWILALGVAIATLVPIVANFADHDYIRYSTEVILQQSPAEAEAVFA